MLHSGAKATTAGECPMKKGVPDTGYLYIDYIKQFQALEHLPSRKLVYKANYLFLTICSYIACIDFFSFKCNSSSEKGGSSVDQSDASNANDVMFNLKGASTLNNKRERSRSSSSYWTRGLYLLFSLHLCLNLHYQYKYDFAKLNLIRREPGTNGQRHEQYGCMIVGNATEYELELTTRMLQAKEMLYNVGAPYSHMNITIEFLYLCVLIFPLIIFYGYYLFYRYVTPINLHAIREHLDFNGERKALRHFIVDTVNKFKESNKLFAQMRSECHCHTLALQRTTFKLINTSYGEQLPIIKSGQLTRRLSGLVGSREEMNGSAQQVGRRRTNAIVSMSELRVERMLAKMLETGSLTPFTKSLNWFDMRSKLALAFQVTAASYLTWFFVATVSISVPQTDPGRLLGPMDYLMQVSSIGLIVICVFATCLHCTYSFIACVDQIVLIHKIQELIQRCIRVNHDEFFGATTNYSMICDDDWSSRSVGSYDARMVLESDTGSVQSSTGSMVVVGKRVTFSTKRNSIGSLATPSQSSSYASGRTSIDYSHVLKADKMNLNLLFVLMHYKIFLAQARPVIMSLNPAVLVASSLLLLTPITIKMHMPYLNMLHVKDIRLFAAGFSSTVIIPAILVILPLCYSHSRCQKLYANLSSLISHIVEVENHINGKDLYERHTVLTLSKELRHPDRFKDQFTARLAGLRGTYTTLVKILFWWGLIVISILVDSQSGGRSLFELILEDPLRAF